QKDSDRAVRHIRWCGHGARWAVPSRGYLPRAPPGQEVLGGARRELGDEPGAAERAVVDGDGAAVAGEDGPHDGESESAAAVVSGAAVVEAGEPFEDPLSVFRRDPRAVVVDEETRGVAVV